MIIMASAPVISVVMTVYNGARYLPEAVDSILRQTVTDFEFIIIDDGSTDSTLTILRAYERQDARIQLISRPNTGQPKALREGSNAAVGEFIARMDADDIAVRERFDRQIRFLREYPDHVAVGCHLLLIDPDGDPLAEQKRPTTHDSISEFIMRGDGVLPHPSAMIRRSAMMAVGGYRTEFPGAEDLDLWLRLSEVGKLANVDQVLMRYRMHCQSITWQTRATQIDSAQRAVKEASQRRRQFVSVPEIPYTRPSQARLHRSWARMALSAGNLDTARKHARTAFARAPFSPSNLGIGVRLLWQVAGCRRAA